MANTIIQLRRTATAGNVPPADMLAFGELILNYADGNLFFKAANNTVQRIGGSGGGGGPGYGIVTANGQSLIAAIASDTLTIVNVSNISVTTNVTSDTITIGLNGVGTAFGKNLHIGTSAPVSPQLNDLWIDTT
jgi:hypothetical protein